MRPTWGLLLVSICLSHKRGRSASWNFLMTQKCECLSIHQKLQPIKQEELHDLEDGNNGNRTKSNCAKCKVWHVRLSVRISLGKQKASERFKHIGWSQDYYEMAMWHSHEKGECDRGCIRHIQQGLERTNAREQVLVDPMRRLHTALFTSVQERWNVAATIITTCW